MFDCVGSFQYKCRYHTRWPGVHLSQTNSYMLLCLYILYFGVDVKVDGMTHAYLGRFGHSHEKSMHLYGGAVGISQFQFNPVRIKQLGHVTPRLKWRCSFVQIGITSNMNPSQSARVWSNNVKHIHPYHRFWKFQVFFNIQHVCVLHFRLEIFHTYARIYKLIFPNSQEGQKANKTMTSCPLSDFEVNRSLWWTIHLNLEKMWPTLRPSCPFERTSQQFEQKRLPKTLTRCVSSPACAKSFDEFLGSCRRKTIVSHSECNLTRICYTSMPRFLFNMYIMCSIELYWVRLAEPLECDKTFFVLEHKPMAEVNMMSHFGSLRATSGFVTFPNQHHRSTRKPPTFVHVWTILGENLLCPEKFPCPSNV